MSSAAVISNGLSVLHNVASSAAVSVSSDMTVAGPATVRPVVTGSTNAGAGPLTQTVTLNAANSGGVYTCSVTAGSTCDFILPAAPATGTT